MRRKSPVAVTGPGGSDPMEAKKIERALKVKMAASKKRGTPKWMVKIMENPMKMDDLGVPLFSETSK